MVRVGHIDWLVLQLGVQGRWNVVEVWCNEDMWGCVVVLCETVTTHVVVSSCCVVVQDGVVASDIWSVCLAIDPESSSPLEGHSKPR